MGKMQPRDAKEDRERCIGKASTTGQQIMVNATQAS